MGVRNCDRGARHCRRASHHRGTGRADARPRLYRAHVLRRGDGGARQHDRHADCCDYTRRFRNHRADDVRRLLGAGDLLCLAARRSRRPAAGFVGQAMMKRGGIAFWGTAVLFLVAVLAATQLVRNEYWFFAGYVILQFIVLSVAWSILGGYAGYVNFGTSAFFGVGVYTAVLLFKAAGAPLFVQIAAAAVVGGLLGFAVGVLTLRMQGIFFSIATIALTIVIETSVTNWRFVGGAAGIQMRRPAVMPPFHTYVQMLFVVQAFLVVLAVATARYIQNSRIGRGLQALRDDELAAECTGVPTLRLKLLTCVISGALMCAAGAPAAMYLQYADPSSAFNLNYSFTVLAMSLIGGTAYWIGPVIGAILLGVTQQLLAVTISSEVNVLVLGVMLVLFVVAAPEGIIGLFRKSRRAEGKT